MRWRIYYGDGTTWNDDAFAAPARNVQMIAVADPNHGWYLCRSSDYYWYLADSDTWQSGDLFGLFDYLIEPGKKRVLFGRTITNREFEAILTRAYNDPEIPQKTGWQPRERENAGVVP